MIPPVCTAQISLIRRRQKKCPGCPMFGGRIWDRPETNVTDLVLHMYTPDDLPDYNKERFLYRPVLLVVYDKEQRQNCRRGLSSPIG